MGNYTIFGGSKILGEAGKQEILQPMFPKILDLKSSSEPSLNNFFTFPGDTKVELGLFVHLK